MIPKICEVKKDHPLYGHCKYLVQGWFDNSSLAVDAVSTFEDALRYWLWHCGVPAKICFWKVKE